MFTVSEEQLLIDFVWIRNCLPFFRLFWWKIIVRNFDMGDKGVFRRLDKMFNLRVYVFEFLSFLNSPNDFGVHRGLTKFSEELKSCSNGIFANRSYCLPGVTKSVVDRGYIRWKWNGIA